MTIDFACGTHVSRYFAALRQQRGLRPGQLAALLGASNTSKVGSLIRTFELGEEISEHWLQRLVAELKPEPEEWARCLELDRIEAERQLELKRVAWEIWADQPIQPFLTIRYMAGVYGTREVPKAFCNSHEQAEGWAADELKRFRAKGCLHWTRRECTWYDRCGLNPQRSTITFEERSAGAWMQLSGSAQRFLLGSDGQFTTKGYGLDQPG